MKNIKLLKEPAYVMDLSYVFFTHFNKEYCQAHHSLDPEDEDYQKHLEQISAQFGEIPSELYVFFHALDNGRGFFNRNYVNRYSQHFSSDFNLSFVLKELSNYPKVIERLIRFYFHDLEKAEAAELVNDRDRLFDLVKNSDYSDTEKSRLYEFFMSPVSYIQKLQYELMQKDVLLTAYYEKNYTLILDIYNTLTLDLLSKQIEPLDVKCDWDNRSEELYLSFGLLNKYLVCTLMDEKEIFFLFGYDYVTAINDVIQKRADFKLDEVGSALAEESRVQILELMHERGEINCKELEKIFNFSGSTAYHHLSLMVKNGVVKTHNVGKTVYYSINHRCIENLINHLKKYTTKKK